VFKDLGDVTLGFPKQIDLATLENKEQYNAEMLRDNLVFGTPEQVIEKLQVYESLGVDQFIYYASMGLDKNPQKHSLDLFINEVIPAFQEP
jgi:alkanesulfonate monooxygenase SsuD/methylene tetrahydromethanopterin reductase-like flavin-dependent oxidoreductase (luciferase family)